VRAGSRLALEEATAGEHLEQHDAEGLHVGLLVERLAACLLRCSVGGGAEEEPGSGPGGGRVGA
jgi:hypothetical protein